MSGEILGFGDDVIPARNYKFAQPFFFFFFNFQMLTITAPK